MSGCGAMFEGNELVGRFTYLVMFLRRGGSIAIKVCVPVSKAQLAYTGLNHVWRRLDVSLCRSAGQFCYMVPRHEICILVMFIAWKFSAFNVGLVSAGLDGATDWAV